jgi:hypothetical protein
MCSQITALASEPVTLFPVPEKLSKASCFLCPIGWVLAIGDIPLGTKLSPRRVPPPAHELLGAGTVFLIYNEPAASTEQKERKKGTERERERERERRGLNPGYQQNCQSEHPTSHPAIDLVVKHSPRHHCESPLKFQRDCPCPIPSQATFLMLWVPVPDPGLCFKEGSVIHHYHSFLASASSQDSGRI